MDSNYLESLVKTREYEDARMREILSKLRVDIPKNLVKQKKMGGQIIDYIDWPTAMDILDEVAPTAVVQVTNQMIVGNYLMITVTVTIDHVSRSNVGSEKINHESFGDTATNAFAQALKRTLAMFGIGRFLYLKDEDSLDKVKKTFAEHDNMSLVDPESRQGQLINEIKNFVPDKSKGQFRQWLEKRHGTTDMSLLPNNVLEAVLEIVKKQSK